MVAYEIPGPASEPEFPTCPRCGGSGIHTPADAGSGLDLVDAVCVTCNIGWHEPGFNRYRCEVVDGRAVSRV